MMPSGGILCHFDEMLSLCLPWCPVVEFCVISMKCCHSVYHDAQWWNSVSFWWNVVTVWHNAQWWNSVSFWWNVVTVWHDAQWWNSVSMKCCHSVYHDAQWWKSVSFRWNVVTLFTMMPSGGILCHFDEMLSLCLTCVIGVRIWFLAMSMLLTWRIEGWLDASMMCHQPIFVYLVCGPSLLLSLLAASSVILPIRLLLLQDFDLCVNCYKAENHPHRMDKLGLGLDDNITSEKQENPSESRRKSIQRCIQSLVHACQCRDANCRLHSCQKMKRVVAHTKSCRRKSNGGCPVCKQLVALCCYHAKHCNENKCLVPFCQQLKQKIRQQQLQQRLHQAQMLRRRMAIMHSTAGARDSVSSGSATSNGELDMSQRSPQSAGGSMSGGSYSGMGKGIPCPPQGAMKAAREAQEMAQMQSRQAQASSVPGMQATIGKPSMASIQVALRPSGKPATIPIHNIQQQRPTWAAMGYSPTSVAGPQQLRMQKPMPQMRLASMPSMQQQAIHCQTVVGQSHSGAGQSLQQSVPVMGGGGVAGHPHASATSQSPGPSLTELLATLKTQNPPHAEVLAWLKKHPALMAQVLRLKTLKTQRQQQLQVQQQQQQQVPHLQMQETQIKGLPTNMHPIPPQVVHQTPSHQHMRYQMIQQMRQQPASQFGQPQQMSQRQNVRFTAQPGFAVDQHGGLQHYQHTQQMMMQVQHQQAQLKHHMVSGQQRPLSPQHMMVQSATPSPQQILQQVRSPPAPGVPLSQHVHSPQPTPSPRQQPIPSPRQMQQQSPHHLPPSHSPHHPVCAESGSQINSDHVNMFHSIPLGATGLIHQDTDMVTLAPADQLVQFVEQMDSWDRLLRLWRRVCMCVHIWAYWHFIANMVTHQWSRHLFIDIMLGAFEQFVGFLTLHVWRERNKWLRCVYVMSLKWLSFLMSVSFYCKHQLISDGWFYWRCLVYACARWGVDDVSMLKICGWTVLSLLQCWLRDGCCVVDSAAKYSALLFTDCR